MNYPAARYQISALDPTSYTIIDQSGTGLCFLLLITNAFGAYHNTQITIVEVGNEGKSGSNSYVEFSRETFAFRFFSADWKQTDSSVSQILNLLNQGLDASNPAELSSIFGGELQGVEVQWPPLSLQDLH